MNLGIQLYPLLKELAVDFDGTLAAVARLGIRRVEIPSFILSGRPWSEVRSALDRHGLVCPSVHFAMTELLSGIGTAVTAARTVGATFIVCAAPWIRDVSRVRAVDSTNPFAFFVAAIAALELDDWRWNADQLNRLGGAIAADGLQLAYHSHNFEFKRFDDVIAYDELLRLTDTTLVKLELDCGWVVVAGQDPLTYLRAHPGRFPLLHARDYMPGFRPTTELNMGLLQSSAAVTPAVVGKGVVDYPAVIATARQAGTVECFIEREPLAPDASILDVLAEDYRSLSQLVSKSAR